MELQSVEKVFSGRMVEAKYSFLIEAQPWLVFRFEFEGITTLKIHEISLDFVKNLYICVGVCVGMCVGWQFISPS